MSIAECAVLVQKGDPDRFQAVMAAPVAARERLFPLYAFNLEIARIPWLTNEGMVAEMRLQWWRDVIENTASGAARAHEIAEPLHHVILDAGLPLDVMDRLIAARRHEAWRGAFESDTDFAAYIEDTGAGLMWLAARALGAPGEAESVARDYGWAIGLARYLAAVPGLAAKGVEPLPDPSMAGIAALARQGLSRLDSARKSRRELPSAAAPALLSGWLAEPMLHLAVRAPELVGAGGLHPSEFTRRWRLVRQVFTHRW